MSFVERFRGGIVTAVHCRLSTPTRTVLLRPNNASLSFCRVLPILGWSALACARLEGRRWQTCGYCRLDGPVARLTSSSAKYSSCGGRGPSPMSAFRSAGPNKLRRAGAPRLSVSGIVDSTISATKTAVRARPINRHGSHALFRTARARVGQRSKPAHDPDCRLDG